MEYVVFRIEDSRTSRKLVKSSDWYPRIVEADSHEEAVERMFERDTGTLRVSGTRQFLAVPLNQARVVTASPRREYNIASRPFVNSESL